MLPSRQENILTDKHLKLLDRFEKDVAIYDRLAEFSVVMSSIGIICSILIPLTAIDLLQAFVCAILVCLGLIQKDWNAQRLWEKD